MNKKIFYLIAFVFSFTIGLAWTPGLIELLDTNPIKYVLAFLNITSIVTFGYLTLNDENANHDKCVKEEKK